MADRLASRRSESVPDEVRPPTSRFVVFLLVAWLATTGLGYFLFEAYQARPGRPGSPPGRWPEGSPIQLDPTRPTLLIFLHPRCVCSQASVAELTSIAASHGDRFAAHAIIYHPEVASEEWNRAEVSAIDEAAIPGLRRWSDPGGRLGLRFGVETSGHILLFEPDGSLLFSGGITPSRGHRGENLGLDSLIARIEREGTGLEPRPIYGCPILDLKPARNEEVAR